MIAVPDGGDGRGDGVRQVPGHRRAHGGGAGGEDGGEGCLRWGPAGGAGTHRAVAGGEADVGAVERLVIVVTVDDADDDGRGGELHD